MGNIFTRIVEVVLSVFENKQKEQKRLEDKKRLDEDVELSNAIKNGDGITVERIRERRKHYPNL